MDSFGIVGNVRRRPRHPDLLRTGSPGKAWVAGRSGGGTIPWEAVVRHRLSLLTLALSVTLGLIGTLALPSFAYAQSAPNRASRGVAGNWEGKLVVGKASLRIWLEVTRNASGKLTATLYSLDQGAAPIPCTDVNLQGDTFSFKVPAVSGGYAGTLNAAGTSIDGTWTQGRSLPLTLDRQPQGAKRPMTGTTPRPAQPPVPLDKLGAVLDREFQSVKGKSLLKASSGVGIDIGVLQDGHRRIFAYGAASPDSIFEIGSVTKTFTGLLLAQMVTQHEVTLNEPVRDLLPPGTVAKPSGREITLLDLASQHSGLPRLPDNLQANAHPTNPYADYGAKDLYAYLDQHGVAVPQSPTYVYSNLGYGLLGFVLAHHAEEPYAKLIENEITTPLHMTSTAVELPAREKARLVQGHNAANATVPSWTFEALAGAGALRSSAGDLLTYLAAQLHPAPVPAGTRQGPAATLSEAITMTHKLRADGPPGMKVGMGWIYQEANGTYWHDGATGGYTSFVAFQPAHDRAVVVLYNREDLGASALPFTQRVAANVIALLSGTPAVPLQ